MAWCIWLFLGLFVLETGIQMAKDGTPKIDRKTGKPQLWSFWNWFISGGAWIVLLYLGGAFHAIGWT